jgi:acetyl esterase/lipase
MEPTETSTATEEPTETATEAPTETATATPTELPTEPAAPTETEEVIAAASPVATEAASSVASPVESGAASPVASEFPSGPLGEQAAWTWSLLSNTGEPIPASEIESHVSEEFLAQVPAEQLSATVAQLQTQYGPFTLVPDSMFMTANEPPTNLGYQITGKNDAKFQVAVAIDPATDLITGFSISPASSAATPVAIALPAGMTDTDISFTSGGDTLYGSFLAPDGLSASDSAPAALIISGSGPTDRNGNSPLGVSANTNLNLAITLAQEGIPSLRYDKLGSGQTGLGTHADGSGIDYELFLQEARDAAAFLSQQPGVDPSKLILVGHSEGALFALVLAKELTDAGTPPAALILAAPLSERYLDVLHEQITGKLKAAVAAQALTQDDADKIIAELDSSIDRLRTTGTLPTTTESPELAQIFSPANAPFLSQIDKIDPSKVAASLPSDLPVLVLLGFKDAQVTGDQVRHLMDGFREAGNDNVHLGSLPKADHTLRIIEGDADPSVDYANPNLEFSPQAVTEIDDFLAEHGLS